MAEMRSDNSPKIQYHILQNQSETHKVCHDVVLFHWIEHKKHPAKKASLPHKNQDYIIFIIRICHITTNIRLTIKTTTATKATLQWKLKLLQHSVPSLLAIKALHAWDKKVIALFHLIITKGRLQKKNPLNLWSRS